MTFKNHPVLLVGCGKEDEGFLHYAAARGAGQYLFHFVIGLWYAPAPCARGPILAMRRHLHPIMRAVLAAALPVLPHASWAIDYDHILVNDPSGSSEIFLRPGDTVTNADQLTGLGAAVDVSVAGNSVHAEGVTISTSRPNDGNLLANPVGVRATGGGTVTLLDSTVTTEGDRSRGGHALYAEDAGSAITATDSRLVTHGINADGVQVERGALVTLKNVEVTTHGDFANGIRVNGVGSTLKADGVTITNASEQGRTGVVGSQGRRST